MIKKKVPNNELLIKLNIRNCPGLNYLLKNCMDLEKEHLQLEEGRCMSSSIDNLIDSVNELTKMTKDGFDSLTKAINNLANQIKEDKSKQ
ncbi:uncharacterized protein OCT59_013497 [Rhizophagus irregularis]|uniref:uncharacterized protein n=1 Tax=Rhizophagus irregularis TaxID=588596 RepID=UPI0019E4DDD6|nr:hypothetical protein OCT59_013497 [Rhizophagus irregularis]GET55463.1 hypothetical protein RIR_jg16247.t1 [Rhizophagus irregularis DAOM 181602=DAOM 197198]